MGPEMDSSVQVINEFSKNLNRGCDTTALTNAFRCLRNLCATNPDSQTTIGNNVEVIDNTRWILDKIVGFEECSADFTLCLTVGLQFLANLLVNNSRNQLTVWRHFPQVLDKCLESNEAKVQHCTLMILYNIFLGQPGTVADLPHAYDRVFDLATLETGSEYTVYIIDLLILNSSYLAKFYSQLRITHKLTVLDEMHNLIKEGPDVEVTHDIIHFIANEFSQKVDNFLNLVKNKDDHLNVVEVVKLLNVLVEVSCDDDRSYLKYLQQDASLFINCVALLKGVHALSKETGNNFTSVNNLLNSKKLSDSSDDADNPVVGFKASLIRIIGNMCWKNSKLQDIIRDFEGIHVILDCCVIDERNPFITQWSILAIHNLCENNLANQQVISLMSKQGVVDAKKLQEMGIVLNGGESGDKICIAPLQK